MAPRTDRLKKLLVLQEQLKELHETRHAGFLAAAASARRDAEEIARHADGETSLSGLFPDVYARGVTDARAAESRSLAQAASEARRVAMATARTNMVARAWRTEERAEERAREEVESIEQASRTDLGRPK
ncbi:MAG: hypothetical protein KF914_02150 [Rhizobiaceae bacterium]|nr:hypothetical protein [Rhizobiaceae bacterium]